MFFIYIFYIKMSSFVVVIRTLFKDYKKNSYSILLTSFLPKNNIIWMFIL